MPPEAVRTSIVCAPSQISLIVRGPALSACRQRIRSRRVRSRRKSRSPRRASASRCRAVVARLGDVEPGCFPRKQSRRNSRRWRPLCRSTITNRFENSLVVGLGLRIGLGYTPRHAVDDDSMFAGEVTRRRWTSSLERSATRLRCGPGHDGERLSRGTVTGARRGNRVSATDEVIEATPVAILGVSSVTTESAGDTSMAT